MISLLADIDRNAEERPEATAIAAPQRRHTFAELRDLVGAVAQRLRESGISPRNTVALDLPAGVEWILDLALLRLAARSASLRGVPSPGTLRVDALIVEPGSGRGGAPIVIAVDDLWLAGALASSTGALPLVDYPRPDSIFRLMMTSGTTGSPRAAAYSVDAFERRRLGLDRYWTDARPELDFMSLSTTGGFHTAAAALRHGQPYLAVDFINEHTLRFAAEEEVRVLAGSPQHIASAIQVMQENSIDLPSLEEVRMAGAAPGGTLMRRIREVLDVPVRVVYGSTEGGGVTSRVLDDDDFFNVGRVLPGLELQVVDADGTPVPNGTEGSIRYRGPGMTAGYLENGSLSPFPGGWFAPGDLGTVTADGSLVLGGRASEVINIAGVKVNPERVDSLAHEFPGVDDAAAFAVERNTGIVELGLAVVTSGGCDVRALDRLLRQQLPGGHPTTFWRVSEIPRNRMGKVERAQLTQSHARVGG